MLELQNSTAEGHKVANQLQKALEEKLQQQQDALWVSDLFWYFGTLMSPPQQWCVFVTIFFPNNLANQCFSCP